jgi:HAD superfamily hydrolase (TIGR01484 family)
VIPIAELPASVRAEAGFLLTDIDDTLTDHGKLPAESYEALWRAHEAGLAVIPVTGRPAGWCDLICRQWPVAAVVGENGAFAFYLEDDHLQALRHPRSPEPRANRARLEEIAQQVFAAVPGTRPAKDQFSRLYDFAVDFREEPPYLDLDAARRIASIFESHGARARISSIHVNAWFGDYDKLGMVEQLMRQRFSTDVTTPEGNRRVLFCGDSPNDEPMFAAFENSVGVANIVEFADDLVSTPRYVTRAAGAGGFVEMMNVLLRGISGDAEQS